MYKISVCVCVCLFAREKKLKQYKDKTAAVRRHFSLSFARSRLDNNGKHRFLSSLLPQHFAPLHEFLLLLVQEQRLHTGQEVLRAEAVLSAKNRNETKRKSKETESFHFRWGGSQIARFQEKKWRPSVVGFARIFSTDRVVLLLLAGW